MNRRSFLGSLIAALVALLFPWARRAEARPLPVLVEVPDQGRILARPRAQPTYDTEVISFENSTRFPLAFFLSRTPHFSVRIEDVPAGAPKYHARRSPKPKTRRR